MMSWSARKARRGGGELPPEPKRPMDVWLSPDPSVCVRNGWLYREDEFGVYRRKLMAASGEEPQAVYTRWREQEAARAAGKA